MIIIHYQNGFLIFFRTLDDLGIKTETKTYDADLNLVSDSGGVYCKNLFLKDRKGNYYYVIIPTRTDIDMRKLKEIVKARGNLRFASSTDVNLMLNSEPGAINPFGVLFNEPDSFRIIMDQSLATCSRLYFHPFLATEATAISLSDLLKFTDFFNHHIEMQNLFDEDFERSVTVNINQPCSDSETKFAEVNMDQLCSYADPIVDDSSWDALQFETFQLNLSSFPCCLL